jgi:hypothetical protein
VYFEFEFDEALVEVVTNRPNGWRDRLAPDGSKTVAQEFGEGLPEIGERQHAGEVMINRDDRNDIESTQPLPTIPLPRRSLQCASRPLASFEAPLSSPLRKISLKMSLISFSISIQVLNLGEMELFSFFADDSGKLTYRLADCIGDQ